jgi:hypothetical protein
MALEVMSVVPFEHVVRPVFTSAVNDLRLVIIRAPTPKALFLDHVGAILVTVLELAGFDIRARAVDVWITMLLAKVRVDFIHFIKILDH